MVAPILGFSGCCCDKIPKKTSSGVMAQDIVGFSTLALDTVGSITCLVVGILGLTGVLALSPALSYSLIGISAGITALYLAIAVRRCCLKLQSKSTPHTYTENRGSRHTFSSNATHT